MICKACGKETENEELLCSSCAEAQQAPLTQAADVAAEETAVVQAAAEEVTEATPEADAAEAAQAPAENTAESQPEEPPLSPKEQRMAAKARKAQERAARKEAKLAQKQAEKEAKAQAAQTQDQIPAAQAAAEETAEDTPAEKVQEVPAQAPESQSAEPQVQEAENTAENVPAESKPSLMEKWKAAMARNAQERAARKQAEQEAKEKAEQEAKEKAEQEAQQEKAPEQEAKPEAARSENVIQTSLAEQSPKTAPQDPAALRRPQMPEKLPSRRSTDPTAISIRTEKHIERILVRQVKLHKRISIMSGAGIALFAVCLLLFAILLVQVMGLKAENAMLMDRLDEIDEHVLATEPPPTEPIVVPIPPEFTVPEEESTEPVPTDEEGNPMETEPEPTVDSPITITKQPTNERISEWSDLSASIFTVTAEGEGLTFQWQKWDKEDAKWNNIQTGSVYLIYTGDGQTALMLAKFSDDVYGKYRCVITNEYGGEVQTQFAEIQKP